MEVYLKEKVVILEDNQELKIANENLAQQLKQSLKRHSTTHDIESKITLLATENERLLTTREDIQLQYENLFEEHENCSHIVGQRESEIRLLATENERLIKIKEEFESEMEELKTQMTEFEVLIQGKDDETEENFLNYRTKIKTLELELDNRETWGQGLQVKLSEFESLVVQLQTENKKIGSKFTT